MTSFAKHEEQAFDTDGLSSPTQESKRKFQAEQLERKKKERSLRMMQTIEEVQ
jgi:hypothetical protein